jgi:Single-strand binding protein family
VIPLPLRLPPSLAWARAKACLWGTATAEPFKSNNKGDTAMINDLNRIQLMGRLGADAEQKSPRHPVTFSIATSSRWTDEGGGRQSRTDWTKAAAHSWQDEGAKLTIQSLENKIIAAYARTQAEQWPINASIHYNEWIRLQEEEFKPVASAFEELLNYLRCSTCETYFHVLPLRGSGPEVLRCDCGKNSFNVKKKSN